MKHEYHAEQVFAMAGVSGVQTRLRGASSSAYSSDFRIVVEAANLAVYPDLSVICGPPQRAKAFKHSGTNPTVLFEILSPET
ncbi:MAG: Uma2 family endonuclease, partial [Bryobacterales bacterium]|nr:Uma2 family endonuclease [Bryobacterales bacterium]